ncbi:hypothetical protein NQ317_008995 [Molorchus minor]|uniref:Endonuclease/exonuclease/phosphatase domain-containing protein n=1 Tax=Molorchus minor TaxID=1323400 RepID=A0ABQ9JUY0_9CUCU|nr:hypothetical protein NQ317_008995 [Molorchus minor]
MTYKLPDKKLVATLSSCAYSIKAYPTWLAGKALRSGSTNNPEETGSFTEEQLEKLITKVCSNFVNQLESKIDKKFERLELKLTETTNLLKMLGDKVNCNEKAISSLSQKSDYLEQYLKRNALRIHGITESENENIVAKVIDFINAKLKISCDPRDIDSAYRLGGANPNQPRIILVNFVQNIIRNEVLGARKYLKGTAFTIFEDLTPERYELLSTAKRKFGKNKVWSAGGKVCRWCDKGGSYDIVGISETWLKPTMPDHGVSIPGHKIVRQDRGGRGGGVAFFLKNSIKFTVIEVNDDGSALEQLWISKKLCFGTLYRPPNLNFNKCIENLENTLISLLPEYDYVVFGGDFNVDFLNTNSYNYTLLNNLLNKYGLNQIINKPTRVTDNSETLIDIIVTSCGNVTANTEVLTMEDYHSYSDIASADMFNETFTNNHNTPEINIHDQDFLKSSYGDARWPHLIEECTFTSVTNEEIEKIILNIKSNATGSDGLSVRLNNTGLDPVDRCNNLGVSIDTDLRFGSHVSSLIQNAFGKLKILYLYKDILSPGSKAKIN